MGRTIGIDLGTTFSAMAYVDAQGNPQIIFNAENDKTTPSVVTWEMDDEGYLKAIVGDEARDMLSIDPENTVKSIKREMGNADSNREIYGTEFSPEEISAFILLKLKDDAEAHFGEEITHSVITVPAYFTSNEREATKSAAELAGWDPNNVQIINEPEAAAYEFCLNSMNSGRSLEDKEKIFVFDLGGGTFDCTIFEYRKTSPDSPGSLKTITNDGERLMGGDDFDNRIFNWAADEFLKKEKVDISDNDKAKAKLLRAVEKAKKTLAKKKSRRILITNIIPEKSLTLNEKLTRESFENLTTDLLDEIDNIMNRTLANQNLDVSDINKVIMVGGSSRILSVQELVNNKFPDAEVYLYLPDLAIAQGAAVYSLLFFEPEAPQQKETRDKLRQIIIPASGVSTHNLGVEARVNNVEGQMAVIIEKDRKIPVRRQKTFTTIEDNQSSVKVKVYEGESDVARENKFIGELTLTGIPPMNVEEPRIVVTFEYATDNTLTVKAELEGEPDISVDAIFEFAKGSKDTEGGLDGARERIRDQLPAE